MPNKFHHIKTILKQFKEHQKEWFILSVGLLHTHEIVTTFNSSKLSLYMPIYLQMQQYSKHVKNVFSFHQSASIFVSKFLKASLKRLITKVDLYRLFQNIPIPPIHISVIHFHLPIIYTIIVIFSIICCLMQRQVIVLNEVHVHVIETIFLCVFSIPTIKDMIYKTKTEQMRLNDWKMLTTQTN